MILSDFHSVSVTEPSQRVEMTNMEVDMVADMEVDKVANMEVNMVANMEVNMVADILRLLYPEDLES